VFGIAVAWHAGVLTDSRGRRAVLVPALGALVVASVAMGFATTTIAVLVVMAALGAAGGYARPGTSSIVADVSTPATRGIAVSGYRVATDLGQLIAPISVGVIAEWVSFRAAFLTVAVVVAIAFWMALRAEETAPSVRARAAVS